mmetsp:Transcript_14712/g.20799  ORF Transcript_14712/g.20799 Transcript_14712/m.20799 type:complete len:218 (-) Transcript_14712:334-987(-)
MPVPKVKPPHKKTPVHNETTKEILIFLCFHNERNKDYSKDTYNESGKKQGHFQVFAFHLFLKVSTSLFENSSLFVELFRLGLDGFCLFSVFQNAGNVIRHLTFYFIDLGVKSCCLINLVQIRILVSGFFHHILGLFRQSISLSCLGGSTEFGLEFFVQLSQHGNSHTRRVIKTSNDSHADSFVVSTVNDLMDVRLNNLETTQCVSFRGFARCIIANN